MINTHPVTQLTTKLITKEKLSNIFTEQLLAISFNYINDYLMEHKPKKTVMMSLCGSDFHLGNKGKDKLCTSTVSIPQKSDLSNKVMIRNLVLTYFTNLDFIDTIRFGMYSELKHNSIVCNALMNYVIASQVHSALNTDQEKWCNSFISQHPELYAEELINLSKLIEPFLNNKIINILCENLETYKLRISVELLKTIAFLMSSYIMNHPENKHIYNDTFIKLMLMKPSSNSSAINYFKLPITYLLTVLEVSNQLSYELQSKSYKAELSHLHLIISSKSDIVWLIDKLVQHTGEPPYSFDLQSSLNDALDYGLTIDCTDTSYQLFVQEWLNWIKYRPKDTAAFTLNNAIKLVLRIFPDCHL